MGMYFQDFGEPSPESWSAWNKPEMEIEPMSEQQGHPAHKLLQELADEAKVNAEPWKAFEWESPMGKLCQLDTRSFFIQALELALHGNGEIRRRPKTVRVSGEVPEEVIKMCHRWINNGDGVAADYTEICASLLSLVEESER